MLKFLLKFFAFNLLVVGSFIARGVSVSQLTAFPGRLVLACIALTIALMMSIWEVHKQAMLAHARINLLLEGDRETEDRDNRQTLPHLGRDRAPTLPAAS